MIEQKSLADRCGRQALTLFSNLDCRDWISFRNHLEHMLGRQAYNDGKPEIALRHFLRILVEHCEGDDASADQDFLDDLELAWSRLGDTADQMSVSEGFTLPRTVFDPSRTAIRVKALNPAAIRSDMEAWTSLEQTFLDKGFPYVPEGAQNPIKRPSSLLDDASINIAITGGTSRSPPFV